jgi:hypothetical protein
MRVLPSRVRLTFWTLVLMSILAISISWSRPNIKPGDGGDEGGPPCSGCWHSAWIVGTTNGIAAPAVDLVLQEGTSLVLAAVQGSHSTAAGIYRSGDGGKSYLLIRTLGGIYRIASLQNVLVPTTYVYAASYSGLMRYDLNDQYNDTFLHPGGTSGPVTLVTAVPPDTLYVTVSPTVPGGGLYKGTSWGNSWQLVLPGVDVTSVSVGAGCPGEVVASAKTGPGSSAVIFESTNGGASFSPVSVSPLQTNALHDVQVACERSIIATNDDPGQTGITVIQRSGAQGAWTSDSNGLTGCCGGQIQGGPTLGWGGVVGLPTGLFIRGSSSPGTFWSPFNAAGLGAGLYRWLHSYSNPVWVAGTNGGIYYYE